MAAPKPKKSGKKPAAKTVSTTTAKDVKATAVTTKNDAPFKGFFARKGDANENILTIFKTPKIWGALIGEVIGTMFVAMFMLTLGIQPLYIIFGLTCAYVAIVGISGAHFNPLITAGMMATRRISAIRGVLYMLAQLLGAWIGALIINAFRLSGGGAIEAITMAEIEDNFWVVALVELLGAFIIAFCFARALSFARRQPLAFGLTVASGITLAVILGLIISQSYFGLSNSFAFNPVVSLMYQILPTSAESFGELAGLAGLAIAAYILVPIIGGIIGFFIADIASRLSGCGCTTCECDKDSELAA